LWVKAGRAEGVNALGLEGFEGGAVDDVEDIEDLAIDLAIAPGPGPGLILLLLSPKPPVEGVEGVKGCSRNIGETIGTPPTIWGEVRGVGMVLTLAEVPETIDGALDLIGRGGG
jgi:hypothetical protein